jgi:hypothetical protein
VHWRAVAGCARQRGGQCSATVSGTTVSVCVNQPPSTTNDCTGNPGNTYSGLGAATAIQVVICQPRPRFFSGLFLSSDPTVEASAVAATIPGTGSPCNLALSPTANPGISISGSKTVVNTPACVIVSDSNSTSGNGATDITGGATVNAACLVSVGADVIDGVSHLNLTQCTTATNNAPSVADPFASVPQPTQLNINVSGVTFQPGLYYFEKGLNISGGSATGTEVTFFIATGQTARKSWHTRLR